MDYILLEILRISIEHDISEEAKNQLQQMVLDSENL